MNLLCFKGYLKDTYLLVIVSIGTVALSNTMVTVLARGIHPSLIQGCFGVRMKY